jgi:cell division protein FtsW
MHKIPPQLRQRSCSPSIFYVIFYRMSEHTTAATKTTSRDLWVAIFALLCAGLVMVYSSSFIFAQERYKDGLYFFKRHMLFSIIGVVFFFIGWKLPLKKIKQNQLLLQKTAFFFVIASTISLIATFIPGISHKVLGANRWINLFGLTFQPSEFAKFAIILYVATQLNKKLDRQTNWRAGFFTYFVGVLPIYIVLLLQPDFGTAALMLCTTVCMLLACGVHIRYLLTTFLMLVPTGAILILGSAYRRNRLIGFLSPWSDPAHKGFQVIQSFIAFYSGKFFGVGLGNSREKLF